MSDTKESMPAQPKTVELEKPPAWAIALSEKVVNGFASVEARLDTVETNVSVLVDDKKTVNERLSRIEAWKENEVNARLNANSERVKGESQVNLKQDAAIAEILTKVRELEQRPDTSALVLAEVKALAAKPAVQKIGAALLPVLMLAISLIGIRLQMQVSDLEKKPATVQPAPTVYLPAPVDGGAL